MWPNEVRHCDTILQTLPVVSYNIILFRPRRSCAARERKACSAKQSKVSALSLWLLREMSSSTCGRSSKHSSEAQSSQHKRRANNSLTATLRKTETAKSRRTEAEASQLRRYHVDQHRSKNCIDGVCYVISLFTHLSIVSAKRMS